MKNITKNLLCVTLVLIFIMLPSCSMFWSSNPTYSGGQMLDDELMSSMRAEIIGENTEATTRETTKTETKPNKPDTEIESDQSSAETEVDQSDIETEPNDSHGSSANEESTIKEEDQNTDKLVYWTKGGGVYHFYKDCGYIKSSSEVLSGTEEEALEAGKSGVCSRCQNRKDKE